MSEIISIPINKLVRSKHNVRKTGAVHRIRNERGAVRICLTGLSICSMRMFRVSA
jgi:hypothetical protein